MALTKYAAFEVLSADLVPSRTRRTAGRHVTFKQAHRHAFQYDPKPGFLYVRSRAISSRCNDNFDDFPADEIKLAYRTFVGKPVFVNHNNANHRRLRGVCIDAALHEDTNPDGTPDTWAEVLMEIDAVRFPKLAQAILAGHIDRTSMGTDVAYSLCSFCGNKATTPLEYCAHIPKLKGKRIRRRTASGHQEDVLVREICHGLRFFENSVLVEPPADPTAYFLGVEVGPGVKTAAAGDMSGTVDTTGTGGACPGSNSHVEGPTNSTRPCPACGWTVFVGPRGYVEPHVPGRHHRKRKRHHDWLEGIHAKEARIYGNFPASEYLQGYKAGAFPGWSSYGAAWLERDGTYTAVSSHAELGDEARNLQVGMVRVMLEESGRLGIQYGQSSPNTKQVMSLLSLWDGLGAKGAHVDRDAGGMTQSRTINSRKDFSDFIRGYNVREHAYSASLQRAGDLIEEALRVEAAKAFITATLDYRHPSGGAFANEAYWKISWNTSPDPKDWGGPVSVPGPEWDDAAATAAVEAAGVQVTTPWERVVSFGGYRAQGEWNRTASLQRAANLIEEAMKTEAYGETVAPAKVDTLRDEICPVCGETDSYDGDKCMVCGYIKPPDQFMDPDLEKAKNTDLRQEQDEPNIAGGDLSCSNCGEEYLSEEMSAADPLSQETGDEWDETKGPDPDDNVQPKDRKTDPQNAAKPDPDPAQDPAKMPRLPKPEKSPDASDVDDAAKPDKGKAPEKEPKTAPKAGDTCPNCGQGQLQSKQKGGGGDAFVPPTNAEKPSPEDDSADEDEKKGGDDKDGEGKKKPPWMKDKKSSALSRAAHLLRSGEADDSQKEHSMRPTLAALAEQQKVLESQDGRLARLTTGLRFVAEAAGLIEHPVVVAALADEPSALEPAAASLQTTADENNPAQPIPDPGSEGPSETTDQALAPAGRDDPEAVGASPVTDVAPAATTSVDQVGGEVANEGLDLNEKDVTAPVAGTEGPRPLSEVKIETEQRIGPWQGNDPNPAFPLEGDFAQRARTGAVSEGRTFASLRLARLRIQAGIAEAADDLALGNAIASDENITDASIQTEIDTLSKVTQASAQRQPVSRSLVPQGARTAGVARTVPSMAPDEAPLPMPMQTVASGPSDDEFLFE